MRVGEWVLKKHGDYKFRLATSWPEQDRRNHANADATTTLLHMQRPLSVSSAA